MDQKRRWIRAFTVDLIGCTARLEVTESPEDGRLAQAWDFRQVGNLSVRRYLAQRSNEGESSGSGW